MNGATAAPGTESKLPQATLHAAIDEPGFGAALGTQVSVWVRDGVQEARLQLHPAELGPVTVQIALEGQAAHVDFTAAVAATRESIEQSLPALAAALRESGFTLAGGGVSSHAGHSGDARRERAGARPAIVHARMPASTAPSVARRGAGRARCSTSTPERDMSQHLRAGDSAEALRCRLTSRSDVKAAQPPAKTNACSGAGAGKRRRGLQA